MIRTTTLAFLLFFSTINAQADDLSSNVELKRIVENCTAKLSESQAKDCAARETVALISLFPVLKASYTYPTVKRILSGCLVSYASNLTSEKRYRLTATCVKRELEAVIVDEHY
jgi:hypothetical protein